MLRYTFTRATRAFSTAAHTTRAHAVRKPRTLGAALFGAGATAAGLYGFATMAGAGCEANESPIALSTKEFRSFTVAETKALSKDSALIRVKLPTSEHILGMTVASCLSIQAEIEGETVGRPYTPCSTADTKGYAEFVVKAYPPRTDGNPGGMGRHLTSLKAGDTIAMKGPWKKFGYHPNQFQTLGMICGGTGITPMYQVVRAILDNPNDTTKVRMLYANRSEDDILLRDRLDALAREHPTRFHVTYTLDNAPRGWGGEVGYVTRDMVERALFKASEGGGSKMVFVCGPEPMMEAVSGGKAPKNKQGELKGCLKQAGFTEGNVFKF